VPYKSTCIVQSSEEFRVVTAAQNVLF